MAKFAIHKKGFFYTDDAWEDVGSNGTVVSVFDTLEDAKAEKLNQDIISTQKLSGFRCSEFYLYSNHFDEIDTKIQTYLEAEFDLKMGGDSSFPDNISPSQAQDLMSIMEVSFHDIVEYTDEEAPTPEDHNNNEEDLEDEMEYDEDELQEF